MYYPGGLVSGMVYGWKFLWSRISYMIPKILREKRWDLTKFVADSIWVYRLVHNTTLNNALRCVVFASTLVETQHDARIDSDPILASPCVAFLRLVVKKSPTFLVINLCISRINATQGLASLCEPSFSILHDMHAVCCVYVYAIEYTEWELKMRRKCTFPFLMDSPHPLQNSLGHLVHLKCMQPPLASS